MEWPFYREFGLVASVAQLVEQLTLNQLVQGSNPCRGTIFSIFIADDWRLVFQLEIMFRHPGYAPYTQNQLNRAVWPIGVRPVNLFTLPD
jgi:hypothetical protein